MSGLRKCPKCKSKHITQQYDDNDLSLSRKLFGYCLDCNIHWIEFYKSILKKVEIEQEEKA
jgi:hypothetical protein